MAHGQRRAAGVVGALVASVALWSIAGIQAFADQSTSPARLGLLPHPAWLIPLVAILGWLAWRLERCSSDAYFLLLAGSLALLPWLPLSIPAFLIWTPLVLAILFVVVAMTPAGRALLTAGLSDRWRLPGTPRSPVIAGALAAALYTYGAFQLQPRLPDGDEPHYLVITQSLLTDGDLQIENNHRTKQYAAYYQDDLKPHYVRRGRNGEIYSIHAPGLPAVMVPAFAVGGYVGAVAFLVFIAGVGTALVWKLGFALTGSREAAWFGWAAVALSAPYAFHAFTIYPDALAGVLVLVGVAALVCGRTFRNVHWLGTGAALAALPWLHSRYAILAATLAAAITLRERSHPGSLRRLSIFFAVPVVSASAWVAFFYAVYGTPNPAAPYGGLLYARTSVHSILAGLPGLFFDQQFGLLPNAPALAMGLLAWPILWRCQPETTLSTRRLALELGAVIVPYVVVVASFEMWWGGHSAPARLLVPVSLVFGVMAACGWAWARTQATRLLALVALGVTTYVTAALMMVSRGDLVYNGRDGRALWVEWVNPLVDLPAALPSFHGQPPGMAMEHVAVWLICFALAWLITVWFERRSRSRSTLTLCAILAAATAAMAAATFAWTRRDASAFTVAASQAWLLSQYGGGYRPIGIHYGGEIGASAWPHLVAPNQALGRLRIASDPRRAPHPPPLLFVRNLPAGHYRMHASTSVPSAGRLQAWTGQPPHPFFSVDLQSNGASYSSELDLPVTVPSLTVTAADDAARASVDHVWLTPVALGSSLATPERRRATRAARYGDTTVFFLNLLVFPERTGFWIAPGISTPLVLQPVHAGAPLRVWLRNGPITNTLSLTMGAWHDTLQLAPGEERLMELPAGRDGRAARLEALAASGFRPRDVDPASTDGRRLAVWMEPR